MIKESRPPEIQVFTTWLHCAFDTFLARVIAAYRSDLDRDGKMVELRLTFGH